MGSTLNDGNISMSHIATSPFTTFQPISMQKESGIDFRNQFCKGGTSRQVLTKKRKSFKRKKRFVQKTHRSKKH